MPQFEPSVVDLSDITQEAENRYGEQTEICRKIEPPSSAGRLNAGITTPFS